jgi:ATP/maltotriose-dependent transcriptional regulator MalT
LTAGIGFEHFVGRGPELARLLAAFRKTKAEGIGSALVIGGDAGVGKSRLLREFENRVQRERCLVLHGCCVEYVSTPYEPFIDALIGGAHALPLERELRGLSERVVAPEVERLRRFRLVEEHLRRRCAEAGALIIAIEDLQWSDAATLDLWRYLARRLSDAPVLTIGTFRSEEIVRDAARSAQLARAVRDGIVNITLEPLSDPEITTLLCGADGSRPLEPPALARIVELSEGSPLVAEELLRSALEGDRSEANRIPGSVAASIIERLRELKSTEQEMLLAAAVIGRDFDASLLAALIEAPEEAILTALRRARNLQLIVERADNPSFRFRHAITRETLYRELLHSEARRLHGRIAAILEQSSDANEDEVAYHLWAAQDAARAISANEAAGDRFAAMNAYGDASRSYERALDFASDYDRARLVEKVSFALSLVGEIHRARMWCQLGAQELRRSGQEHASFSLMLRLARQLYESGDVDRALETVELVRAELRSQEIAAIHYHAATTLAGMLATLGRARQALAVLDEADGIEGPRDEADRFRAHTARGNAFSSLGDYSAARTHHGAALGIAERIDNIVYRVHSLGNVANVSVLSGALTEAQSTYAYAIGFAERYGLQRNAAMLRCDAGLASLDAGKLESALQAFRDSVESRSIAPMSSGFAWALGLRLRGLIDAADIDAIDIESAVQTAMQLRESQLIAAVTGAAARTLLEHGEIQRARAIAEKALEVVEVPDQAYWLCDVAAELLSDGKVAVARALLEQVAKDACNPLAAAFLLLFEARRTGDTPAALRAADAFNLLGWQIEEAIASEAGGQLARAAAIYQRLGATRALRRIRTGSVQPPERSSASELTRREREVVELAARGYSNKSIAAETAIGERTVETHLAAAYRKLGVRSRAELAALR